MSVVSVLNKGERSIRSHLIGVVDPALDEYPGRSRNDAIPRREYECMNPVPFELPTFDDWLAVNADRIPLD
jgi:hypothetical protein